MKIQELHSETRKDVARIAAAVIWEDCDRPAREIYFETDARFASDLVCNPHSFLLAAILPAMRHGEARIAIDEEICPELRNGLMTVMGWLRQWYGPPRNPVRIESRVQARPPANSIQRAGSFLSGGIDSLATLRSNRLDFPLAHPLAIKDCFIVHGFDIGGYEGPENEIEHFELAAAALAAVAQDAEITLIPVHTNIKHLDDDVDFWEYEFHGAALAAIAHAFSRRLDVVSIAGADNIPNLSPNGTHPLLDPNYSSANLRMRHDGVRFSRLDKVKLVSEWAPALQNVRVCTSNVSGKLNCGECEKCVRTMLALVAIGKLDQTNAFPFKDLSRASLNHIVLKDVTAPYYRELIAPLTDIGRLDLVEAIEAKVEHFDRYLAWKEERDWKGNIKRFDRRYLGGNVTRVREKVRRNKQVNHQHDERTG